MAIPQAHFENLFSMKSSEIPFFLYDSDCGVCTKASHFFKQILGNRIEIVPMHIPELETMGTKRIKNEYWLSFHIVENGHWTTEGDAILKLASIFPFGDLCKKVASFPPIFSLLKYFLSLMQKTRKAECEVDF